MNSVSIESGVVLGFGGTNARFGTCNEGDIEGFSAIPTPERPREFFGWMARQVLDASHSGNAWMVAGFPGPVSEDGNIVGPMANVPGLSRDKYNLAESLASADPAVGRLLKDEGFHLVAVNDGELAAHAAADRIGRNAYDRTAALIIGTGVGAGIVNKDKDYENVSRSDKSNPAEIGHIPLPFSLDPTETYENLISGPALMRRYNLNPREMSARHPAWKRVGELAGQMSVTLGLMNEASLVVPCGGIGSGASEKFEPHLRSYLEAYSEFGNGTQKNFAPEVIPVPSADCQIFEMYGGEGVMRDFQTRKAL